MFEQPYEYPQFIHVKLHNAFRECRLLSVMTDESEPENFLACTVRVQLLGEREAEWDEFYTLRTIDVQQMDRQMLKQSWRMQNALKRMIDNPKNPIMERLMQHKRIEEVRFG